MSIFLPFPPAATITLELWILYYAPIAAEVALRKVRFKSKDEDVYDLEETHYGDARSQKKAPGADEGHLGCLGMLCRGYEPVPRGFEGKAHQGVRPRR